MIAVLIGLGFLGMLITFLSWNRIKRPVKKTLVWSVAGAIVLLAGFFSLNAAKVDQAVEQNIMTREGRISLSQTWGSSIEQFSEAPLAGTGSRTFFFYSRKFRPEEEGAAVFESKFVHNEYLQALADYGIIGLILILALVGIHFHGGLRFVLGYSAFQSIGGSVFAPIQSSRTGRGIALSLFPQSDFWRCSIL